MLLVLLLLAACGGGGQDEASDTTQPDPEGTSTTVDGGSEPERGGSATLYLTVLPASIAGDAAGTGTVISFAVLGRLIEYGDDFEPVGVIAESFLPVDPTTWELKLREGVTFTDGTPFDAAAVKHNWDWHADPANGSWASATAEQVASVEVVDPLTMRVLLTEANPEFFADVANGPLNAVGSPTAMEDPQAYAMAPVGAGPFMVSDYLQDDHVTMVRNPDYFDAAKPYLDELTFRAIGEQAQRLNVASTEQRVIVSIADDSERRLFEGLGLQVAQSNVNGALNYMLNSQVAPFDDPRVRQAVAQAIDLEAMNDALYDGAAVVADGAFREDSVYYDPDITQLAFDPEAAQALIDDYVAEHGPVSFDILTSNIGGLPLEAEFVAQSLNELDGVTASIDAREHTAYRDASQTGNFAMSWGRTTFEGSGGNFRGRFYSDSPGNYLKYSNPEVDRLFDDLATAIDIDERVAIVREINRLMHEDAVVIWTLRSTEAWGYTADIGGVEAWGNSRIKPEDLYVAS